MIIFGQYKREDDDAFIVFTTKKLNSFKIGIIDMRTTKVFHTYPFEFETLESATEICQALADTFQEGVEYGTYEMY